MKRAVLLLLAAALPACAAQARSPNERDMNALLVIHSQKEAFSAGFQKYLADNGARIIRAFPPHAFMGYVPEALDKALEKRYGAVVYRSRIEDMDRLAGYGEGIFYAATEWNKHCQEDPPEAPLVISHKVLRAKKGESIVLSWNEVMKAVEYRLEIARDGGFRDVVLKASPLSTRYELYPAFFADGVYYWRAAGVLTLNTGERVQGRFSEAFSLAVSKPAGAGPQPKAPKLPGNMAVKSGGLIAWEKAPDVRYYRAQVSAARDFSELIAEEYTAGNSLSTAGLALEQGSTYYLRVMGAAGAAAGPWSGPCEVRISGPE